MRNRSFIVRAGIVTERTADQSTQINAVHYYQYSRLARELESFGNLTVDIISNLFDISPKKGDIFFANQMSIFHKLPDSLRDRSFLVEADPNSFRRVAQSGLLGAITMEGLNDWRSSKATTSPKGLVGRRITAVAMNAVGGPILGTKDFCYIHHGGFATLPEAIDRYIFASIRGY